MDTLKSIKERISQGDIETALSQLEQMSSTMPSALDEICYLRGNAYRKAGNWQQALNNYRMAYELNPDSPAREAHQMVMDILNFYNKDMYNQ